jgi:uncharacterized protein with NAD-binding domain and iron-sulfur cluster
MSPEKKILVVGAGAAGMVLTNSLLSTQPAHQQYQACAECLSQHPDRYKVTIAEAQDYCGGQAFSIPIDKERHGAGWLNQG